MKAPKLDPIRCGAAASGSRAIHRDSLYVCRFILGDKAARSGNRALKALPRLTVAALAGKRS